MKLIKYILSALVILFVIGAGFIYLAPEKTFHFLVNVERQQSGLVRKEITTSDGLRWAYLEGGKGAPLVLVHGFGGNKDNFVLTARYLTPRFHVIIPDLIGFGKSDHPMDADYSPSAQAERLRKFVHALNISDTDLGGNSMGGEVILSYAALYPKEVKSLWLLDPGGIWSAPDSEVKTAILKTGRNPLVIRTTDEFPPMLHWAMSKPPYLPRPLLDVLAQERISNYELELRIFKAITEDSIEKRIAGLKTPALIVWGKQDRVINVATAGILNKLLPNSRVVLMPGIGHVPMMEAPQKSAEDYKRFRQELVSAKKS